MVLNTFKLFLDNPARGWQLLNAFNIYSLKYETSIDSTRWLVCGKHGGSGYSSGKEGYNDGLTFLRQRFLLPSSSRLTRQWQRGTEKAGRSGTIVFHS